MKNKTCIFLSTFLQRILVGLNSIANLIFPTPLVEVCALEDLQEASDITYPQGVYCPLCVKLRVETPENPHPIKRGAPLCPLETQFYISLMQY